MIKRKEALAETISGVLNTVPQSYDPEDNAIDNTHAQAVTDFEREDDENEEELLSAFRKKNVDLLSDIDTRYSGKKASRSKLYDESDEDNGSDLEAEEGTPESDDNESSSNQFSEKDSSENESHDDEEDSGNEDLSDERSESADYSDKELNNVNSTDEDDTFKQIQEPNTSMMNKKGICVRNQLAIWEHLLEMRIQLQKCLLTSNKMPQSDHFNEIKTNTGEEFMNTVSKTKNNVTNLLDKMQTLQKLLTSKNTTPKQVDSDEEIKSDTDASENEEEKDASEAPTPNKKRKIGDYEKALSNHHKNYINHRDTIIKKWYDKTRLAVNKNNSVQHTVLDQIKYHLSDKEKLIKRTQLKRSNYNILGYTEEKSETTGDEDSKNEYNTEIFDDDDFYHQLLRELIEMKSSDITDPIQLGRQWIQLQNMRSKMKRKIDTRATKGRKIRYVVHNKLVNFMAPNDENLWTDEAKTELYNTLFGKKR